jgi:hypothetical protein
LFERFADGLAIPAHGRRLLGLADKLAENLQSREGTDVRIVNSQHEWLRTRRLLNQHRSELTRLATSLYPSPVRLDRTGILMPSDWRPEIPVDLDLIDLTLRDDSPRPSVTGRHEETRPVRPLLSPGKYYESYHRAMRDLDSPRLFENRVCYRLLGFEQAGGSRSANTRTHALLRYDRRRRSAGTRTGCGINRARWQGKSRAGRVGESPIPETSS